MSINSRINESCYIPSMKYTARKVNELEPHIYKNMDETYKPKVSKEANQKRLHTILFYLYG